MGKDLAGLGGRFLTLKTERRKAIAELMTQIADCIDILATNTREHRDVDYGKCAELREYLWNVADVVGKALPKQDTDLIIYRLGDAVRLPAGLEDYFSQTEGHWHHHELDDYRTALKRLEEAAGYFRATGNMIRAS